MDDRRGPNGVRYDKRDFRCRKNLNYAQPDFRLEKAPRIVRISSSNVYSLRDSPVSPASRLCLHLHRYFPICSSQKGP